MPATESEKMSDSLKALGTSRNTKDDVLMFTDASSILTEKDPKTKRSLISLYSRVGSRARLGSATGFRNREFLGDLEKGTSKH